MLSRSERYRAEVASPREHLALLRWQITQGHALDRRDTFPGHLTTSAFVLSPDHAQVLLIDHVVIGRPVMAAPDRRAALESLITEAASA